MSDVGVKLLEKQGVVEALKKEGTSWQDLSLNVAVPPGDRLRTLIQSRATLQLQNLSTLRLGPLTEMLVRPQPDSQTGTAARFLRGLFYILHRDRPAESRFETPTVSAAIRGTDVHVQVADNGRTVVTVFDGLVELFNPFGVLTLRSGEQGVADQGQAPVKSPGIIVPHELIQWCIYYPAVLATEDLPQESLARPAIAESVARYREGDLLAALRAFPLALEDLNDAEKVFYAALLLGVGDANKADGLIAPLTAAPNRTGSCARALHRFIEIVSASPRSAPQLEPSTEGTATEAMVRSYAEQNGGRLEAALPFARQAVDRAPAFGFAWERVAELEFGFRRTRETEAALQRSLELSSKNAQAATLRGFVLAARDRHRDAEKAFLESIQLDSAQANAWLGLGLIHIRQGQLAQGRLYLQVAATLEPQRASLRSYLAKAWHELGQTKQAKQELEVARDLDPLDPSAWLYLGLLRIEQNQLNAASDDIERSKALTENRRVYRSQLALDEDRAVRRVNLANLYRDLGMTDWSAAEAGTAVASDYSSWGAHRFLANSFNELRDPTFVNLRYETPWLSEYLLATLLSPVGAGPLSQRVSQQEYARFFDSPRMGWSSASEYLSRGAFSQSLTHYGHNGRWDYAVEAGYRQDRGEAANRDLKARDLSLQLKHQFSNGDGLFVQAITGDLNAGDLTSYLDLSATATRRRLRETRVPEFLLGYHREWSASSHTLLLANYLSVLQEVTDGQNAAFYLETDGVNFTVMEPIAFAQRYRNRNSLFSTDLQHIHTTEQHSLVLGTRAQFGTFDLVNVQTNLDPVRITQFPFGEAAADQNEQATFERVGGYLYETYRPLHSLALIAGVSFDALSLPLNHRFGPITDETEDRSMIQPKAGFVWQPGSETTVRLAYARSLGGVAFDQSFRLEPTQVAGLVQTYRGLIPESVFGPVSGARMDTMSASLDHRFASRTYVSLAPERLRSVATRSLGAYVFDSSGAAFFAEPGAFTDELEFEERAVRATITQLIDELWAVSASYRFSRSEAHRLFPTGEPLAQDRSSRTGLFVPSQETIGELHQGWLELRLNHPSGFFATAQTTLESQHTEASQVVVADGSIAKLHLEAGWRLWRRRAEVSAAVINATDVRGAVHPIHGQPAEPSSRTLVLSLRANF